MTKTSTKTPKPEKQIYFVPNIGEIEAVDLEDLEKQVTKLSELEDGDGNR